MTIVTEGAGLRVSYQIQIWKRAHLRYPYIPTPVGNGMKIDENGNLEYDWTEGDILPQESIHILLENALDTDNDDDEENIRVASLSDITYDDGDDDFEDNSTALTN